MENTPIEYSGYIISNRKAKMDNIIRITCLLNKLSCVVNKEPYPKTAIQRMLGIRKDKITFTASGTAIDIENLKMFFTDVELVIKNL